MKKTKKFLGILLSCLMLMSMLAIGVSAEGTQDNPINANDKWFGYGVDCYLLNPTFAEGNSGLWYELTAEQDGILYLEHKYKNVDYTITLTDANGITYEGGCVDGVIYNGPIMTLPVQVGDVATIQIVTKDAAAGTVYANMNIVTGTATDPIKVKSAGITVYVGAGQTVYFQDDTLNADYATKGLLVDGSVDETVFYAASVNSTSGAVTKKAFTDSDGDATIEVTLGGSLGSAGAPPVKPMWAIENNSTMGIGTAYFLTIVDEAHECNWDDDQDTDCNTCGAIREAGLDFVTNGGCSVREDKDAIGLAAKFDIKVEGMAICAGKYTQADYTNATVNGYKLIGMGVVANNGVSEVDIPCIYLCELDEGSASFTARIVNIPEDKLDVEVTFQSYFIVEMDGEQVTLNGSVQVNSYNGALKN